MQGIDMAGSLSFNDLQTFGAVAQLGERLHGMQEVVGSSPIGSIFPLTSVDA